MSHVRTAVVCGNLCTAPEGDYFVKCSFDPNHVILRSRLPYHIVKCKKNYKGPEKKQCPFDATEYIDSDKLMDHMSICESKRSLCAEKYETADLKARGVIGNIQETPYFHASAPMQEEEWCERGAWISNEKHYLDSDDEDDDDISVEQLPGVGRGVTIKQSTSKKGMGRGAVLERIYRDYLEKQASSSSNSSSSCDKSNSVTENVDEDQFADV